MRTIDDAPIRPAGKPREKMPGALTMKEKQNLRWRITADLLLSNPLTTSSKHLIDLATGNADQRLNAAGALVAAQEPAFVKLTAERLDALESGAGFFGHAPERDARGAREKTDAQKIAEGQAIANKRKPPILPPPSNLDKFTAPIIRNVPVLRTTLPIRKEKKIR
jgi:hypothetical protein